MSARIFLTILLIIVAFLKPLSASDDLDTFEPITILALMREYGQIMTRDLNANRTQSFSQYLVVTMLTENEFKASAGWRTNNINTLQTTKRIQYYNNENAKRTIGIFKKGKSLHGELLFLYLKGDQIGELEKKLPDDKSKGKPRLLFYSFYIPCACIAGCDFSCAEELKSEAKLYKDQYNFIVGFEAVFKFSTDVATNRNKAEMFLKGGGIELYEYLDNHMTLVQVVSQPSSPTTIFQVELFTFLTKNAVAEICLPPEQNKRNSIAIVFIKHVTAYACLVTLIIKPAMMLKGTQQN